MPSGVNCVCGSELDLNDAYCRSCGKKKNFKVDPRLTDEAWIEWRKYQAENAPSDTSDSNLVESSRFPNGSVTGKDKPSKDSLKEVKQEFRDRNAPKKDVFKAAQTRRQVRKVIRNSTILVSIALLVFFAIGNSEKILDSGLIKPIVEEVESFENPFSDAVNSGEETVEAPAVDTGIGEIAAGKPLDLYVTWPAECVIPAIGYADWMSLVCYDTTTELTWQGKWWEDEKIRRASCAYTYNMFNGLWPAEVNTFDSPEVTFPAETLLYVFDSKSVNPLASAALAGIPELKTATIGFASANGQPRDPTSGDDLNADEAQERQYANGYCVAHFTVDAFPEFDGALTISTDSRLDDEKGTSWIVDSDRPESRQFLFPGDSWMDGLYEIWDANNFGANPEVYLP
jgi:hypothetical protein